MADRVTISTFPSFPTPWKFDDAGDLIAADGTFPLLDDDGMAMLVKYVNGYEDALRALRAIEVLLVHYAAVWGSKPQAALRVAHAVTAKADALPVDDAG
jgi:hypothetical protein